MTTFNVEYVVTENRRIVIDAADQEEAENIVTDMVAEQLAFDESPFGGILEDIEASYVLAIPIDPEEEA